jgi:hypothetical protein
VRPDYPQPNAAVNAAVQPPSEGVTYYSPTAPAMPSATPTKDSASPKTPMAAKGITP